MIDPRDSRSSRRKTRDRSVVHLLTGIVLLLPPVVGVAQVDAKFAGVPVALLYVFGVWTILIVVARLLAGPLSDSEEPPASAEKPDLEN